MLILLGIFFISIRAERPRLKRRDIRRSGVRAIKKVYSVATGVAPTSNSARQESSSAERRDAVSGWDTEAAVNAQVRDQDTRLQMFG